MATRAKKTAEKLEELATEVKDTAKATIMKPVVYVQYQGAEVDISALVEAAKASFREEKKRTKITDFKLYVKPEENAAYYVINEKFDGKIDF